ncbi:MAG TPA: type VI secretion system baseplate subunit TssG [Polyangiaceae bacterium]|nr:type VI secretion system baseplate subunit TssG [Polyangiaceae bacterium]
MAHSSRPAIDAVSLERAQSVERAGSVRAARQLLAPEEAPRQAPEEDTAAASPSLGALLGGSPLHLTFYAALRKLESLFRGSPRFGEALDPALEPVRLGQDPSLAFRGSALTEVRDGDATTPARVRVSYFGAFGPHGPLPTHLTQYVDDRRRRGDGTWAAFLDIFHHRLIGLFYRAWANAQPTVNRDRPETDRFAHYLGALIGHSTRAKPRPPTHLDELALGAATHFVGPTRHADGLRKTLELCFGVPIAIDEFIGQWLEIPAVYCWVLPASLPDAGSALGVLGVSSRVGTQVYDRQSKFRVIVGPVALDEHRRFLPGGDFLAELSELVRRYVGDELRWDMRLILREADRRATILNSVGLLGQTANLGQSDGGVTTFQDLLIDPAEHFASRSQS